MEFSKERMEIFQKAIKRYYVKEAVLLHALRLAQEEFGYLSTEAMDYVASLLGIPSTKVYSVATFYTLFNKKPVGRYLIQVCINISCSLMGAEHILRHIEKKLGIQVGETTPDDLFTLLTVECLGSCGTAPMMQINDSYYENLTETKVDEILEGLAKAA